MKFKTFLVTAAALTIPAGAAVAETPKPTAAAADQAAAATPAAGATADAGAAAGAGAVQAATKADITVGSAVVDQQGAPVGKVEAVTGEGAVVATGAARAQIPFASFGKSDKGLVIAMSKSQLEAAAKGASGS